MTFRRFDVLSKSASGLSYVRERRLGVTRVLTPSELEDFNDPPQCIECGEQFGCEHFNCAGEPLLTKSVNSAFIGTDLDLRLRRMGVDTVVAFGMSTDMCVSTTIRTGANLGWKMVLVADASDCFDLPDGRGGTIPGRMVHDAHVATLAYEFCDVIETADLIGLRAAA